MRISDFVTTGNKGSSNFPLVAPSNHIGPQRVVGPNTRMNPRTARTTTSFVGFGAAGGPDKARVWTWSDLAKQGYLNPKASLDNLQGLVGLAVKTLPGEGGWTGKVFVDNEELGPLPEWTFYITGVAKDTRGKVRIMTNDGFIGLIPGAPGEEPPYDKDHTGRTNTLYLDLLQPSWIKGPLGILAVGVLAYWWLS